MCTYHPCPWEAESGELPAYKNWVSSKAAWTAKQQENNNKTKQNKTTGTSSKKVSEDIKF